jgi:hypothetical protein
MKIEIVNSKEIDGLRKSVFMEDHEYVDNVVRDNIAIDDNYILSFSVGGNVYYLNRDDIVTIAKKYQSKNDIDSGLEVTDWDDVYREDYCAYVIKQTIGSRHKKARYFMFLADYLYEVYLTVASPTWVSEPIEEEIHYRASDYDDVIRQDDDATINRAAYVLLNEDNVSFRIGDNLYQIEKSSPADGYAINVYDKNNVLYDGGSCNGTAEDAVNFML